MTESMFIWICLTFFCYILQPCYTGATKTSKACYGAPGHGPSCTQHYISCSSTQTIAIYDAYYTDNTECGPTGISSCATVNPDNVTERGHQRFNNTELVSLYNNCSTETQCVYRAPRRGVLFSVVKYQCIEKAELLNTSGGVLVAEGLSQVSLIHRENRMPTSSTQSINYTCSFKSNVTALSISVHALDARLGRETQGQCFSQLSILPENEITIYNCSSVFQPFERLNVSSELPIFLNFVDCLRSSSTLIWLLINASDPFSLACEPVACADPSTGTTISHISSTDDNNHISTGDTGAIIGGVVATVVAILVVTLVSVWIIRNRRAKGEVKENIASFPLDVQPDKTHSLAGKIPQNNSHEIQDLKKQNSDYDYATADGLAVPQNAKTYFIKEPAGKQNTEQFSKASTTESDYDHIGDKASPQTSDYDTTASVAQSAHTGGTIGEDNYGYNLFHKKTNPQTQQNDYDTAASATKAVAQLSRTDRNTDEDDYDHFPSVTNHPVIVSSPYDTASGRADNSDYSFAGPMKGAYS